MTEDVKKQEDVKQEKNRWEILDIMQAMHPTKVLAQVYVELGPKVKAQELGLNLSQICNNAIKLAVERKLREQTQE